MLAITKNALYLWCMVNEKQTKGMERPTVVIMMGMGGAGKSTVLNRLFPALPVVDCDKHKQQHPDYDPKNPGALHEWSTIQAERERYYRLSTGQSFAIDSTGKNLEKMVSWVSDAQKAGFRVHLCYVRVAVSTALARNAKRTRVVPAEVILEAAGMVETTYSVLKSYVESYDVINND